MSQEALCFEKSFVKVKNIKNYDNFPNEGMQKTLFENIA